MGISKSSFEAALTTFNPLMLGGNKKVTHESCRFVKVCVTFLLPPVIKRSSIELQL